MRVDVSSIRRDVGASLTVSLDCDWPSLDWGGQKIHFTEPVKAELELTNTGELLLARGRIRAISQIPCSRCLELFELTLDVGFSMGYREMGKQAAVTEADDDMEDDIRFFSGDVIDLGPDILDTISLALPMKPLCSNDCKGLCSQCGHNLNTGPCACHVEKIDPRLAVLGKYLQE